MIKRILYSLFITIGINSYILASGSLQSERFFQNTGGLIDHISPLLIPTTDAKSVVNITMDDRGLLTTRNGYTVIQSTFALLGKSTHTVTGGGYHTATSGSSFFSVVVGTSVYRIGNTFSSYSTITGTVTVTDTITNLAQKTDLNDKLVFCNELDKPFYITASANAVAIHDSLFSAAKTCSTYGNYLVIGNTTESSVNYPSRIRWSDINNVDSFPVLNYIDVEPDDGDKIVAVASFDESVYIFKHRAIYKMVITGLDGPDAFIIRPLARNVGAWSKNSVKAIPNVGLVFLAQNTVYVLSNNGLTPIGDPIQRTLDNVQRSMWANAVGEVYPHKYQYWLSVSTAGTTNTEVLVYDYIQRNWTTYSHITASMLAQSEDSNGQNILISGDYGAKTYKQDNGSVDYIYGSSVTIVSQYTTGDIMMGNPELTKNFKYLYVYSVGDLNYTIDLESAYDFDSNYEYTQTISLGSVGAVYDTGIYDTDLYPASGASITRLELNRSARSIRLRFTSSSASGTLGLLGWVIVYQPEDLKS